MLLDRQIFTLDGIATELPYYQYMYVDVCSEAGLSWWPAATGCEPSREHSLLARVFCLRIMNFKMLSSARRIHKQTDSEEGEGGR